jgi:hypothetical protein
MYSQRMNEIYTNLNHVNLNSQMGMYNQLSQMNQVNPMSQYQPPSYFHSQYGVPSVYPTNNCTQENFSQFEENNHNSFSQMVKNNLETGLKKIPENFSNCLMEKMNVKLEKSNDEILSFKMKLKESNNRVEKQLGKVPDCLEIVERELDQINSNLIEFKEFIAKNQNYMDSALKKNQNDFLDQIAKNRENEKKLSEYIDQIEIMKLKISQSINYAQSELKKTLKLKDESFEEIKNLLIYKFQELSKEISGASVSKLPNLNLETSNKIIVDSSVKKIKELKTFINKFQKNNKIKEIKKESFSLLANKENNRNTNNIKSDINRLDLNFPLHRKGKFADFSFYEI